MFYNWSWLPHRRPTTPPPLGPTPQQLGLVEVRDEGSASDSHTVEFVEFAHRRILSFLHDDQENNGTNQGNRPTLAEDTRMHVTNHMQAARDDSDDADEEGIEEVNVEDDNGGDGDVTGEEDIDEADAEEAEDGVVFNPSACGLKEISNLASFTVSSYKPGCGVKELRDDDINQFWQSDGPQPHRLNIHFIKRVEIRMLRLYLDYELDESYTPTKIQICAGFGPNLTVPFTTLELNMPKGWIDVPIAGAGGGPDGHSLCCWFIRVIVLENHQNGKDTHMRGVKVYALDDNADTAENNPVEDMAGAIDDYHDRVARMNIRDNDEEALLKFEAASHRRKITALSYNPGDGGLNVPDFMRDPEIR